MLGYILLVFVVYLLVNAIIASFFQNAAALKGHGKDAHAFGMVLIFGIIGCIYVAALPDKITQEQNQQIIQLLSTKNSVDNG